MTASPGLTPRRRPWWPAAVAGAIAIAVVVGPPLLLLRTRDARLAAVSTPAARSDWDDFREEMRRQSGDAGPVKHKVPKSVEPPELVWLRDYTPLAISVWVLLSGFLSTVVVWLVWGATARPGRQWGEAATTSPAEIPGPDADRPTVSGRGSPAP